MRRVPTGPVSVPDSRRHHRLGVVLAVVAAVTVASAVVGAGTASADEPAGFAPPDRATVRPGSMTVTGGAQCTADFVFTDGADTYLGQAAHCAGTGESSEVDGCASASLPLGTPVQIEGATRPGTLAYSSWLAMQDTGETDPDICADNDFALVRIDPADVGRTNPTLPFYGGPVGVDTDGTRRGETVFAYSNSSLRDGLRALRPKTGKSLGTGGGGLTHTVLSVPPGIPGDSGSGYVSADGTALGVPVHAGDLPASGAERDLGPGLRAGLRELVRRRQRRGGARAGRGAVPAAPDPDRLSCRSGARQSGPTRAPGHDGRSSASRARAPSRLALALRQPPSSAGPSRAEIGASVQDRTGSGSRARAGTASADRPDRYSTSIVPVVAKRCASYSATTRSGFSTASASSAATPAAAIPRSGRSGRSRSTETSISTKHSASHSSQTSTSSRSTVNP